MSIFFFFDKQGYANLFEYLIILLGILVPSFHTYQVIREEFFTILK